MLRDFLIALSVALPTLTALGLIFARARRPEASTEQAERFVDRLRAVEERGAGNAEMLVAINTTVARIAIHTEGLSELRRTVDEMSEEIAGHARRLDAQGGILDDHARKIAALEEKASRR
jgi:hypothetical protein